MRELRGLTQKALSETVPTITQWQLSRMENGDAVPDDETVALLAVNLGVEYQFFERSIRGEVELSTPQLRARSRLPKRTQYAATAWGNVVHEQYQSLTAELVTPRRVITQISAASPAQAAREVRRMMDIAPGAPVNGLILAIERLGVDVVGIPFHDDYLDAYCAWLGSTPLMVILSQAPADRLRFSAAHELGHLILHRGFSHRGRDLEAQADEFAAHLLTPPDAISRDLPAHPTLTSLTMVKTKWGVSIKSLIRRCRELGIIDQDRATSLYRQISARGWNRKEPGFVFHEKPRGFRRACEVCFGEPGTLRNLAEASGWSLSMAREIWDQHASVEDLPFATSPTSSPEPSNVVPLHRPSS